MPSLGVVRRLPSPLRRLAITGVRLLRRAIDGEVDGDQVDARNLRQLLRLPDRPGTRSCQGERVVVAGLFRAGCGLQRGAELMVLDLRARGVEVLAYDFTDALNVAPTIAAMAGATSDLAQVAAWQPTDIVIHMNPPLFAQVLTQFPPLLLSRVTVVGYWAWELTVAPSAWKVCARFCDEVWTPSPFVADAATGGLPGFAGKIRVVPHAVGRDPMQPLAGSARRVLRSRFGFAEDCFVIGTSFSFESNYARKNPCAAIDAFRLAFRAGEQARLIIRCSGAQQFARLYEHLVSFAGDDPRIAVWDTARVACPIRQFYGVLDLYVSLHRSEGYGLTLMEAAQAGLPVVATDWGLAPDIAARPEVRTVGSRLITVLDSQRVYDRYPGATWAEPDLFEAASQLTRAYEAWWSAAPAQARAVAGS